MQSHRGDHFTPPIPSRDDAARQTGNSLTAYSCSDAACELSYDEFRARLVSAELAGVLSEFHALCFHAILALAEGSEFAHDYVEMAEATATTPYERALVVSIRLACDGPGGFRLAGAHSGADADTRGIEPSARAAWRDLLLALGESGNAHEIRAPQDRRTDIPPAAGPPDRLQWKRRQRAHQP